jgi:predicted TIM-barrel fold metal-dependent hydrolase
VPVLEAHPSLRLCFGHAGGGARWFGDTSDAKAFQYGQKVIELCTRYDNVYAEVGYLEEILSPGGPRRFRGVLEAILAEPQAEELMDKLMYGTDWHMIFRLRDHPRYLARFADALDSGILRPFRERFFALNALRFLKFTPQQVMEWRRAAR